MPTYTLASGRRIDRNGKPFATLHGVGIPYFGDPTEVEQQTYDPAKLDEFARLAVERLTDRPAQPYCRPTNAGMDSQARTVCKRIAELIESLDRFSWAICRGTILDDCTYLRDRLIAGLDAEGYYCTYDGGPRMKVYEPGSKTGARKKRERAERLAETAR